MSLVGHRTMAIITKRGTSEFSQVEFITLKMEGCCFNSTTTRYKAPNLSGCYLKEIMVLRVERGPKHHPFRERPVRSPIRKEIFYCYFSTERLKHFFVRVGRPGGGVLTCF